MEHNIDFAMDKNDGVLTGLVGIRYLLRWGWFVLLSMLLTVVCSYKIPDLAAYTHYRATLQVQVRSVAGTSLQGKATTAFFASLLQSPGVLDLALTRLHAYSQFKNYRLVDLQDGRVTATVIKDTNIIQLSGYSTVPGEASLIARAVYDALVQNIQKDRASVIDGIDAHLNTELAQVQADMQRTGTTLEQLKALKQITSSQYTLLANQYAAQKQRLQEINAGLATLKNEGYDNLLALVNATPMITTLPAATNSTKKERLVLSPLVGLIMGLGGVFVASRFSVMATMEDRKRTSIFPRRLA